MWSNFFSHPPPPLPEGVQYQLITGHVYAAKTQINCHGLLDTFLKLTLLDDYFRFPVWWWLSWGFSLLLMAEAGLFNLTLAALGSVVIRPAYRHISTGVNSHRLTQDLWCSGRCWPAYYLEANDCDAVRLCNVTFTLIRNQDKCAKTHSHDVFKWHEKHNPVTMFSFWCVNSITQGCLNVFL